MGQKKRVNRHQGSGINGKTDSRIPNGGVPDGVEKLGDGTGQRKFDTVPLGSICNVKEAAGNAEVTTQAEEIEGVKDSLQVLQLSEGVMNEKQSKIRNAAKGDKKDGSENVKAECEKALLALKRGNSTKALKLIRDACTRNENSVLAHRVHAQICSRLAAMIEDPTTKQRHFKSALASVKKGLEKSPNSLECILCHAQLLLETSNESTGYEEAISECERGLFVADPVDPGKDYIYDESQQEFSTSKARIEHVQNELRNLRQKANYVSLTTWMKSFDSPTIFPIKNDGFEILQPKRPLERKKTKTAEERRQEIEVRVAAARLLQQKAEAPSCDEPTEEEKGANMPPTRRKKNVPNNRRTSKTADMEGQVEKMRSFWHSACAEERAALLEAPLVSLQEHIGTSTSSSCLETLNEALDFARKNNTWRFWACCKCGDKFIEHQEHINHVIREHVGALGHELEDILPQEVEQVWVDQLMNDDCRPINEASAIELLKTMFGASLEDESVEEGWTFGVKEESTLSSKCNGNSMQRPKLLVIADPELCFRDLPISDDMNRRRLLDRIYSLYRKLLGNKCLANVHVERIIQFSIEETQKMILDSAMQFPPSLIYVRLLPIEQLQTIHRHLLELAHACGLDRHESQVNNGETVEKIVQDRLYFSDDYSLLHVDERVIKEACVKVDGDGYARFMNSDMVPALSSKEMKDFSYADQQLSWIYGKAEYEENICEWKAFQDNRAHEGRDVFRNVEREYRQVHHLCERKHRCLSYDEALTFAENLCLSETMKADGSYQSYEEVLKERLKEMQVDISRKQHSNASRVEFEVISSVLKDAEAVHVSGFSNEDMRSISSAKRLYDFEDDSEIQESSPCSNTCIEISLQRQKESIFAEVSQLDAKLIRSINELHVWQQKLNRLSLFDYSTILLPTMKSFLKYRLESAAEKDALQRSDAAREAFLAELANEKIGAYKDSEVSKLPREKLKDKKKAKELKKTLPNNYVSGTNGCHGTGSTSSDEIEDEHDIGLDLTDKELKEEKIQQELELRRHEELEAEERKLNEALELQRKVEEEAKEKILAQQQKRLADEAARLAVIVEDSTLSSNISSPVLTHQNGHIYLESKNVCSSPISIVTPIKTVGEEFYSTASSNAGTFLRLGGSSLSSNSGPSAVTSPSTGIASVQALPLGPSDSKLPLSKLKSENLTIHLNPRPKHVSSMQCPKEGHTDEIVKSKLSGSMQNPDSMFRPSRFVYPGSDEAFLNTTGKNDMSSSVILFKSATNNASKKHSPEVPSGSTASRTHEAAGYNLGVETFLPMPLYSSTSSQHVLSAHNTDSRLNEVIKVDELEPQIAIKDSIPGAALNKASDVQQIFLKKNKESASRIRRRGFVKPPQDASPLPEEMDKEISECSQVEAQVQYRTHSASSNDKKRLRELKVEQDEEERFQADLKQAMQQSLGKTLDLPDMGTTSIHVDNNTGHDFPSIKNIQEGVVNEVGKGLQNEVGQYNCFLNVVIQSLWRLRSFREEILSSSSINHAHVGTPCIVCALRDIFLGMSSGLEVSRAEPVAPTALRVALSAMFAEARIFQEAQMNDASEVLSVIFDCIHKAFSTKPVDIDSDGSITGGDWDCQDGKPCIVHSLFGFDIAEQMNCRSCGLESRHLKYTTFFHNINASALRTAKIMYQGSSLDELLKLVDMNHLLACDIDVGGCGQQNYIHHLLRATPHVFTTVLGWQNNQENVDDISATVDAIDTVVDIGVVYRGVDEGFKHHLVSVVCYYGQHYHCFAYSYEHSKWVMFDDTTVKVIGGWHDVADTCRRGHLQPQVLFYEAASR